MTNAKAKCNEKELIGGTNRMIMRERKQTLKEVNDLECGQREMGMKLLSAFQALIKRD